METQKIRNIFIIDSRTNLQTIADRYSKELDVIYTLDFGVKHDVEKSGGKVYFLDKMVDSLIMNQANFCAANFFKKWHINAQGEDIFTSEEICFGKTLRIYYWSEYLHYIRLRMNLEVLKKYSGTQIYVACDDAALLVALSDSKLKNIIYCRSARDDIPYYFRIDEYMNNSINGKGIRERVISGIGRALSLMNFMVDRIYSKRKSPCYVYAQIYHSTTPILHKLSEIKKLKAITSQPFFDKRNQRKFSQRITPMIRVNESSKKEAKILMERLSREKCEKLILPGGLDITGEAYEIIEKIISTILPLAISTVKTTKEFFEGKRIRAEIMISNLGLSQMVAHAVLQSKGVPSFMIINGFLSGKFLDEAKDATYINCYSKEIWNNYFDRDRRAFFIGDPRMDQYASSRKRGTHRRNIKRDCPTIGIGTAGFNNLDLCSNVAIEFEFIFEILMAFEELWREGNRFDIKIKVRPNGVIEQYEKLIQEYYPHMPIKVYQVIEIPEFLSGIDFYISTYSQTLFEAACLGIPVTYYKNDLEKLDPPFCGSSELVTARTAEDLKKVYKLFQESSDIFETFQDANIIEKYIGPIDGRSTERNLNFLLEIIKQESAESECA
jgi:hypothetical protein